MSCATADELGASFLEACRPSLTRPQRPKPRGATFLLSWGFRLLLLAFLDAARRCKAPSLCWWVQIKSFPEFQIGMLRPVVVALLPAACSSSSVTAGLSKSRGTLNQLCLVVEPAPRAKPLCSRSMTMHACVDRSGMDSRQSGRR